MGKNPAKRKKKFSNVLALETFSQVFWKYSAEIFKGKGRGQPDGNIFWIYLNAYSFRSRRLGTICLETGTDPPGDTFFGEAHKEPRVGSFDFRFTKTSNCRRCLRCSERVWTAFGCRLALKSVVFFYLEGSVSRSSVIEIISKGKGILIRMIWLRSELFASS